MCKKTASLAALLALIATAACDSSIGGTPLNPTPLATASFSAASSVRLRPSGVTVQTVAQPVCPDVPPFVGSLNLDVESTGPLAFSLEQIQLTFTDDRGLTAPSVTLPAPVPTRQAGSTLIEARSRRSFPLRFPFGCGTARRGTLVIVVVIADELGQEAAAQAKVAVR
jgi:hypothetical protein